MTEDVPWGMRTSAYCTILFRAGLMKERVMKRALMIAALLICGLAAFQAYAADPARHGDSNHRGSGMQGSEQHRDWNGGDGDFVGEGHMNRLEKLNLSQSQKDRIAKLRDSHKREMIQSRADLQTAQLDFRKLMADDHPNKRAINAQIDRMASIRADMMKSSVEQRLEVREILTPDQRAKLREGRKGEHKSKKSDVAPPREQDQRRM